MMLHILLTFISKYCRYKSIAAKLMRSQIAHLTEIEFLQRHLLSNLLCHKNSFMTLAESIECSMAGCPIFVLFQALLAKKHISSFHGITALAALLSVLLLLPFCSHISGIFFCFLHNNLFCFLFHFADRLCGLVVRVPDYRSTGLRFDSRRYQIY
jgi:hypothetical protein